VKALQACSSILHLTRIQESGNQRDPRSKFGVCRELTFADPAEQPEVDRCDEIPVAA
jgi:hypothetical protein